MKTKKVLITGGAGFIGSNLCKRLTEAGYAVTALDNLYLGDKANVPAGVPFHEGDACNRSDLEQCGTDFDYIIALAGTSSAPMFDSTKPEIDFVWAYQNAITSFTQTLEFARRIGTKKVLYASTSSLYGNNPIPLFEGQNVTPPNHYAVTKGVYEDCARCYNKVHPELDIIGFRFMSVYGPNEEPKGRYANMISQFAWDLARGLSPVIYGSGEQFRDFTHVDDVIQGITRAMKHKTTLGATVYNIGRGESTSFNDIFTQLQTALKTTVQPVYIENPVKEGYVKGQHADISKIQTELGFAPNVTLVAGIAQLVAELDLEKIRETSSDLIR